MGGADARKTITESVKRLMRAHNMDESALADRMGIASHYMPNKMRDMRWTMEDLDRLAEIFKVDAADIVSNKRRRIPPQGDRRKNLYAVTFEPADDTMMTCLEAADSAREAIFSITSVWDPMAEVVGVSAEQVEYFSVNLGPAPTSSSFEGDMDE